MPRRLPVALAPVPQERPRRARLVVLIAVAALVLGAVALAAVVVRDGEDPVAPGASGANGVPPAPEDLAPRHALVLARVTGSGDVVVRQWVRSASTLFGIALTPPAGTGSPAGPPSVRVRDVQVFADGGQAPGPERLRKESAYYPFAAGARDVFVTYHLKGAVERSGSVAGRALATVTAVDVDVTPQLLATTYAVSGGAVLNLACSAPREGAVPYPCGEPDDSGWRVRRDGAHRNDVVMAQVDLP